MSPPVALVLLVAAVQALRAAGARVRVHGPSPLQQTWGSWRWVVYATLAGWCIDVSRFTLPRRAFQSYRQRGPERFLLFTVYLGRHVKVAVWRNG